MNGPGREWWLENEEKWWQKALCRRCALQPIAQLTLQIFNETKKTSSATDKMFSRSHRGEKCFCTPHPRSGEAGDDDAQLVGGTHNPALQRGGWWMWCDVVSGGRLLISVRSVGEWRTRDKDGSETAHLIFKQGAFREPNITGTAIRLVSKWRLIDLTR